jgi:predicted ferric reductase
VRKFKHYERGKLNPNHANTNPKPLLKTPHLTPQNPNHNSAEEAHCTIFYLRGHSSFSKNLSKAGNSSIKLIVDGYYGPTDRLSTITNMVTTGSHVVVVAGGIGITPYLSILSSIPAVEEEGKVTLIWSTRDEAFANFLINNRRLEKIVRNNVKVHVHITRGEREDGTNEEEEVRKEEEEVRGWEGGIY